VIQTTELSRKCVAIAAALETEMEAIQQAHERIRELLADIVLELEVDAVGLEDAGAESGNR